MVPLRRFDDDFSDIIRKKQFLENHGENDNHECSKNLPLLP